MICGIVLTLSIVLNIYLIRQLWIIGNGLRKGAVSFTPERYKPDANSL